ncbi:dual specificity protein phosphatase 14-like [Menidia menidia]
MRVSQVSPGLFLADLDSALSPGVLRTRGVTLVVNASGLDLVYPALGGLQVLPVPVQDQPHAPLRDYFDPVSRRISQNRTGSTLVHCTAGRSRSPTLVLAHLIRSEGLSLREAYELVLGSRPSVRPNVGFWRQLLDYERVLRGRVSVQMSPTGTGVLLLDPGEPESGPAHCVNL